MGSTSGFLRLVVALTVFISSAAVVPADAASHGQWLGDVVRSRDPRIIIAEHVLLSDNHIVTWDQIGKEFQKRRATAPLRVEFYLTNGVYRSGEHGFNFWQERINRLFTDGREPLAVTYASISSRKSAILDTIRTDADLQPDPARKRIGVLLGHDGKPVGGAQVFVVPDNSITMLDGFELSNPLDEQWAWSDDAGRFTVYLGAGKYWIVAIHPTGFVCQCGPDKIAPPTLSLQPWAVLTITSTREIAGQLVRIADRADPTPNAPSFDSYSETKVDPIQFRIPAGRIDIQRDEVMKDGRLISTPVKTITLQLGERRTVSVAPADKAAHATAKELFDDDIESDRKTDNKADNRATPHSKSGRPAKPTDQNKPSASK